MAAKVVAGCLKLSIGIDLYEACLVGKRLLMQFSTWIDIGMGGWIYIRSYGIILPGPQIFDFEIEMTVPSGECSQCVDSKLLGEARPFLVIVIKFILAFGIIVYYKELAFDLGTPPSIVAR